MHDDRLASFAAAELRLAQIAYSEGEKSRAHAMVDGVLTREPKNTQAIIAKAHWLLAEGKIDEARSRANHDHCTRSYRSLHPWVEMLRKKTRRHA